MTYFGVITSQGSFFQEHECNLHSLDGPSERSCAQIYMLHLAGLDGQITISLMEGQLGRKGLCLRSGKILRPHIEAGLKVIKLHSLERETSHQLCSLKGDTVWEYTGHLFFEISVLPLHLKNKSMTYKE